MATQKESATIAIEPLPRFVAAGECVVRAGWVPYPPAATAVEPRTSELLFMKSALAAMDIGTLPSLE